MLLIFNCFQTFFRTARCEKPAYLDSICNEHGNKGKYWYL